MKVFVLAAVLIGVASAVILPAARNTYGVIPSQYIVKLRDGVSPSAFVESKSLRNRAGVLTDLKDYVRFTYKHVFNGFSATLDDEQLHALDTMAEVEYIEPNQIARAFGQTQPNAEWGLARTSSRDNIGSNGNFFYKAHQGEGATVYVLDTGIYPSHNDYAGRRTYGTSFIAGEGDDDGNGHGTHCAGTVAGTQYGVAKKANLVAVKVLSRGGSGSWDGIIGGLDWVVQDATSKGIIARSVISMSLGGGRVQSVNDAATRTVAAGVTVVAASGNSNADACNFSPAGADNVIAVNSMDIRDAKSSFSNYGTCTKIWAPGSNVKSAWPGSPDATNTISGTSMACPHVAGLAAYYMIEFNLNTPAAVLAKMQELGTPNKVTGNPANTPNLLLFNGGNGN